MNATTDALALISRQLMIKSNKPSLSDTFVDSNILTGDPASDSTSTLLQIESALASGNQFRAAQTASLLNYLTPFLSDDAPFRRLLDSLSKADSSCKDTSIHLRLGEDYRNDTFLSIQPALNLLERDALPDGITEELPASARGSALYALASAIRYGACLELVTQTIEGTAELDDEGYTVQHCEVARLGKIRFWQFDASDLSGSLFVDDMKVDLYKFRYDEAEGILKTKLVEQWSYDWLIEVSSGGYTQAKRESQRDYLARLRSDPNADPFVDVIPPDKPGRPALPAEAKDFTNPDSIWGRGLTGRLFATGKDIVIKSVTGKRYSMKTLSEAGATADFDSVYTAIDGDQYYRDHVVDGNVVFGPTHAMLRISEESCIDIMFALSSSGDFPTTIDEFPPSQRGWCMGRCKSPLIANSR
jgi:hypothetical protein